MRNQIFVYCFFLLSLLACSESPPSNPFIPEESPVVTAEDTAHVYSELLAEVNRQRLTGLAVAIVSNNQVAYLDEFGYQDIALEKDVKADTTMFRWASLSKVVTELAAHIAAGEGKLDLDEDIRVYLPEYRMPPTTADFRTNFAVKPLDDSAFISTRMLLEHRSGIKSYFNGKGAVDSTPPLDERNDPSVNTGVDWAGPYLWNDENHLLFEPDSRVSYTSLGYNLAAMVIEKAVGVSFWEYVKEKIAVPIGISPSNAVVQPIDVVTTGHYFQPDYWWVDIPDRVKGYTFFGSITKSFELSEDSDVSWKLAAGGFTSTVEQLSMFCEAILSDDKTLPAEAKTALLAGHSKFFHGGAQPKVRSRLVAYPAKGTCFVAMSNAEYADMAALFEVLTAAYDQNPF